MSFKESVCLGLVLNSMFVPLAIANPNVYCVSSTVFAAVLAAGSRPRDCPYNVAGIVIGCMAGTIAIVGARLVSTLCDRDDDRV